MKILMVCLGNICRSPLAHGIMEKVVSDHGLDWKIDSAGTGDWHIGKPPDPRSIRVAKESGIDISGQRCRQFKVSDFDYYQKIFVMDNMNLKDLLELGRNGKDRAKVKLLLEDEEVPDPYWDDHLFIPVFKMIDKRCRELVQYKKMKID